MHQGVFKGSKATENHGVLILGESHHHTQSADPTYTTNKVVKNYFSRPNDPAYRFFDKIAACFGYSPGGREIFWNKVWFGNYVDESDCGIRTSRAINLIEKNSKKYNQELFEFVNQNGVDLIFCFSRLVYYHLPERTSFEDYSISFAVPGTGGKRDWVDKFMYKPGARANGDMALDKQLIVYGFRHPSSRCGFCPEHYKEYLQNEIQRNSIFNSSGLLI